MLRGRVVRGVELLQIGRLFVIYRILMNINHLMGIKVMKKLLQVLKRKRLMKMGLRKSRRSQYIIIEQISILYSPSTLQ